MLDFRLNQIFIPRCFQDIYGMDLNIFSFACFPSSLLDENHETPYSNFYLIAAIGAETVENGPSHVSLKSWVPRRSSTRH